MKPARVFRPIFFRLFVVVFLFSCPRLFAAGENDTVYRTSTGQKYHRPGCSSLGRSKIAVSLEEAVKAGYEPCAVCRPPVLEIPSGLYRVNQAGHRNSAAADISRMLKAEVIDHVDGDTVRVRIDDPPAGVYQNETIRLLGVDAPETSRPNTPVQRFGRESSDFTKDRLFGRTVFIALDWDLRDRYGRLLAYIYTGQGRCFNAALIREGYAYAYLRYPFQFMDEFRSLEREARGKKRGLWRD